LYSPTGLLPPLRFSFSERPLPDRPLSPPPEDPPRETVRRALLFASPRPPPTPPGAVALHPSIPSK
jgi:hypothetical protein